MAKKQKHIHYQDGMYFGYDQYGAAVARMYSNYNSKDEIVVGYKSKDLHPESTDYDFYEERFNYGRQNGEDSAIYVAIYDGYSDAMARVDLNIHQTEVLIRVLQRKLAKVKSGYRHFKVKTKPHVDQDRREKQEKWAATRPEIADMPF